MSLHLSAYLKKKITFMFVPHDGGKPVHIKMTLPFLHALAAVLAGVLFWALWIVAQDVNYHYALADNKRMERQMRDISGELESSRQLLNRVAKLDFQMREMLKLKNPRKIVELSGTGGPSEEETKRFAKLLERKNDQLMAKISTNLGLVKKEAQKRDKSFKEIQVYLDKQRSILSATPAIWPLKGWVTSGFGKRASPLTGEPGRHMGVDIANEANSPIRATADGLVTYAGWQSGYGRVVVIEHGFGFSTRYGHCARVNVKVGQDIKRGQLVGYVGSTGKSTGSHLHYEVRIHGMPVNPEKYLPALD